MAKRFEVDGPLPPPADANRSPTVMINATEFAKRYSEHARFQIAFVSNGELGSKLIDANRNARIAVCNACMEDPNIASDELIRDLYDAETAYSKAAFAVWHQAVAFLATQLLTRGGESNIRCYINCAGRGQDAWMSSQCVTLSSEQQTKALATLASLASTVSDDLLPRFKRVQANVGRITPTN